MQRILHRTLLALLVCGVPAPASALVVPLDFAVRNATDVAHVLTEDGIWLVEGEQTNLACPALYETARWILWTGHDGHALAVGDEGAWLTTEAGCHWRRTTGAVDGQRVVGVYQPVEGHDRVIFATDDPFGGTSIIETVDGGFTTNLSGGLAVSDTVFAGFAGHGDVSVVVGRTSAGDLRSWWSHDSGETFQQAQDTGVGVGESLEVAGCDGEHAWFWDDGRLYGLTNEGEIDTDAPEFDDPGGVVAADSDGAIWLASGTDGLWRRTPDGVWEQRQTERTTSVRVAHGNVWIARAVSHAGAPLILRSDDGGATWRTALGAPEIWGYPPTCKSSLSQQCAAASNVLRAELGLEVEIGEEATTDPEPSVDLSSEGCTTSGAPGWLVLFGLFVLFCVARQRTVGWRSP